MHYTIHPIPGLLEVDASDPNYQPAKFEADEFFVQDNCYVFRQGETVLYSFPMQHVWCVIEEFRD